MSIFSEQQLQDWSESTQDLPDALMKLSATIGAICGVLITKGLTTTEELNMASARVLMELDQARSEIERRQQKAVHDKYPDMAKLLGIPKPE